MSHLEKLKQIEDLFKQTFLIVDKGIIKLLCATVLANRFDADPVWLFLVAASGSGKTEFISSINKLVDVVPLSTVTSKTFISGKPARAGDENSLLFKIGENGILTFKDFTTMLSLSHEERQSIMGQLREIYDGAMTRAYGTGEKIEWRGKIGLIAGVTYIIHIARELYAAMGERFVMYALEMPERMAISERAMDNVSDIKSRRELIQIEMQKFLDESIGTPTERPKLSAEIKHDILLLAELSTRARSPIEREWRSPQKEILFVHPPEIPTRFASQLSLLAAALSYINGGELLAEDKKILFKIALDSITETRRMALKELARYDEVESAGLAVKLDYPTNTARRWLEDLNALKVVERIKTAKADRWRLKQNYRDLIQRFDNIVREGAELTEDTASPAAEITPDQEALIAQAEEVRSGQEPAVMRELFDTPSGEDMTSG